MYKRFIENKKVVCFDLDGTIVDSEPIYAQAFANVLELTAPDLDFGLVFGRSGEPLVDKWGKLADAHLLQRNISVKDLVNNTYKEFLKLFTKAQLEPREGFWDLVYTLKIKKELKLALTTNTERSVATQVVNALDINDVFDFMVFGDDVKRKKPNPEMYLHTAKHFGVKPSEMLVFEDSIAGTTAAYKSGASLIVMWDQQTSKKYFPEDALTFTTDFTGLADNMDRTVEETIEDYRKAIEASQHQQTQK